MVCKWSIRFVKNRWKDTHIYIGPRCACFVIHDFRSTTTHHLGLCHSIYHIITCKKLTDDWWTIIRSLFIWRRKKEQNRTKRAKNKIELVVLCPHIIPSTVLYFTTNQRTLRDANVSKKTRPFLFFQNKFIHFQDYTF